MSNGYIVFDMDHLNIDEDVDIMIKIREDMRRVRSLQGFKFFSLIDIMA